MEDLLESVLDARQRGVRNLAHAAVQKLYRMRAQAVPQPLHFGLRQPVPRDAHVQGLQGSRQRLARLEGLSGSAGCNEAVFSKEVFSKACSLT